MSYVWQTVPNAAYAFRPALVFETSPAPLSCTSNMELQETLAWREDCLQDDNGKLRGDISP